MTTTKSATDTLAETARNASDTVRNAAGDLKERGQQAVSQASEAATEMAQSASQQATTFASELIKMTRNNPLGLLAAAALAGVVIGLFLRGSSNRDG
jgi:ElaB/YqjD/DUF883 family membrane-anchored ribosome-binding protein